MPNSSISLASYFAGALEDAPIGFVASTTDRANPRYLRANAAYLQLCGRNWTDIAGRDLVKNGAALISAQRERRLWMLEHIGRYQHEFATLRHSSGKPIDVIMSAQRVVIDGQSIDVEYISQIRSEPRQQDIIAVTLPVLNSAGVERATFTSLIAKSLAGMPEHDSQKMSLEMLASVVQGVIVLSQMLPSSHPVSIFAKQFGESLIGCGFQALSNGQICEFLEDLSSADAQERLLDLATTIWTLARFQKSETREQLLALVKPYTVPPQAFANR